MDIRYINSKGVELSLSEKPYILLEDTDLFDYSWEYDVTDYRQYRFNRPKVEKQCSIAIVGSNKEELRRLVSEFYEKLDTDVNEVSAGKIIANGWYRSAFVVGSKKTPKYINDKKCVVDVTVLLNKGGWIKDDATKFVPGEQDEPSEPVSEEIPLMETGHCYAHAVNDDYPDPGDKWELTVDVEFVAVDGTPTKVCTFKSNDGNWFLVTDKALYRKTKETTLYKNKETKTEATTVISTGSASGMFSNQSAIVNNHGTFRIVGIPMFDTNTNAYAYIRDGSTEGYIGTDWGDKEITLDYPHSYPYDYSLAVGNDRTIKNDFFADCDFRIEIEGYAKNPSVTIGDNIYRVYATVNAGDVLVIDSRTKECLIKKGNGLTENVFAKRDTTYYLFNKIKQGENRVYWNSDFTFTLTIFEERSEPTWM